jgi:hypothetical protein
MPPLEITSSRRSSLVIAIEVTAIIALICDSLIGLFASLLVDTRSLWQILNAILFISAAPLYFVRLRSMRMAITLLWGLFLFRWIVLCFDGNPPRLCNPIAWPMGPFLFSALVLLQFAYAGRSQRAAETK